MFRGLNKDKHLAGGQSSPSQARQGGSSPAVDNQESSWIGLLSRPASSLLQKCLSGRARTLALCEDRPDWMKTSSMDDESDFLRQLDNIIPVPQCSTSHLTHLRCLHDAGASPLPPPAATNLPWLTPECLQEIGLQRVEEMNISQNQTEYWSSARTLLSHVWLSSVTSQGMKPTACRDRSEENTCWGSLSGGSESQDKGVISNLTKVWEGNLTGLQPGTKAVTVFVQSQWFLEESAGLIDHKEERANNRGAHQTSHNTEGSTPDHHPSNSSQGSFLTLDQDNGYSSLEEEHFQMSRLYLLTVLPPPEADNPAALTNEEGEKTLEEERSLTQKVDEEDEGDKQVTGAQDECTKPAPPQCQNKAIAFIMGCPCSDDDDCSQSDGEYSDDDDGFDSKGSSSLSESSDEDKSSDSEVDSESEHLWTSLCHSRDPYNPRNFTAQLNPRTSPQNIPTPTPPSSTQCTPASSPNFTVLPLASPASDIWDESTSASETDETENLWLWASFNSSDPYNPLNFQVPLRARESIEAGNRTRKAFYTSSPELQKEESAGRLDSGFSRKIKSYRTIKKVSELHWALTPVL